MNHILLVNEHSFYIKVLNGERQLFALPDMIHLIVLNIDPSFSVAERINDCTLICYAFVELNAEVVDIIKLEADQ